MKAFIAPPGDQRCTATTYLKDGSLAMCMRHSKVGSLCKQHSKIEKTLTEKEWEVRQK